jgi:isopenicillin-N epimerase
VLVDGAHSLGYMPLHLPAIGADYYVTNCHKWLCNARGAALLHIPSAEHRALIRPHTISHGYNDSLLSGLMWDGSRDYSAALTVPSALRFWQVM